MQFRVTLIETLEDLMAWSELRDLATDDPKLARGRYAEYITSDAYRVQKLEADFWTAAFFWPMSVRRPEFIEGGH